MMDFLKKNRALANTLKGFAAVAVIVIIVSVLGIFRSAAFTVEIEDEVFTITYEDETVVQFSKEEIRSAEYMESFTRGTAAETIAEGKYTVGTWENDEWGSYTLCIRESVEGYVVVTTEESVFVFNYESKDTTEAMCSALLAW